MKSVRRRSMMRWRRTARSATRGSRSSPGTRRWSDRPPSRPESYPVPRYASVYQLVSARALSHTFTYLADGVEKGSIVTVPFGRARRRGVVVGLEDDVPADIEPVAV